jgi:alcohol dehydrogenase (cytochrome c)
MHQGHRRRYRPARSTIALDVATGRIKGHFQYNPNESWHWDEVSPPILADYQRNGRTVSGLIHAGRDGYLWFLERTPSGPIKFVDGTPFVHQNVSRGLDPVTGRPQIDPARKPGTGKTAEFCPSIHGGKNWPPIAFNPQTRMPSDRIRRQDPLLGDLQFDRDAVVVLEPHHVRLVG